MRDAEGGQASVRMALPLWWIETIRQTSTARIGTPTGPGRGPSCVDHCHDAGVIRQPDVASPSVHKPQWESHMTPIVPARDGERMLTHSNGQDWLVSWHPVDDPQKGKAHGAAGICVTAANEMVLISHDGEHWGFPAGRPEGTEAIEETLRREMLEEACVTVIGSRLLGYSRSECVRGRELGLVLIRSYWRAEVRLQEWEPEFEIRHRRVVPESEAKKYVRDPDLAATRVSFRALDEAVAGDGPRPS
ncbi:NUDIX hydrolase [Nonomuraea jabiensis]|uniref:NUDIX hydrolase n=1 Tax=Nonomuraea jabiensis TaxID=882448 RepID=UPI003D70627D